ncbi:MAG: Holliday junction resolvase RuvX [Christensenellales bacterium]
MRKMALDLGDKRIGIALSDMSAIIASPYESYQSKGLDKDIEYITELARSKSCDTIIIGYPINMDGTKGKRALYAEQFRQALKLKCDLKVELQDERMTTITAERYLLEADMRRDKRKAVIDKVAACIILRQYLEKTGGRNG